MSFKEDGVINSKKKKKRKEKKKVGIYEDKNRKVWI